MIKLWFVPEILVFVREMSLKFEFGGRHTCINSKPLKEVHTPNSYNLTTDLGCILLELSLECLSRQTSLTHHIGPL